MLALAAPLVVAELGWTAMGIVDTVMVGRLPASAVSIGAVSLGGMLYYTVTIFAGAILFSLDTVVSQAFGAGRQDECNHALWTGMGMAVAMSPILMLVNAGLAAALPLAGVNPAVAPVASSYLRILNWGTPFLLIYFVTRRYLQSISLPHAVMFTMLSANVVNLAGNEALIYGRWGAPAMGTDGSAWSTVIARFFIAAAFVGFLLYYDRSRRLGVVASFGRPDIALARRLFRLGMPAATHVLLEISVFAAVTAFIAQMDAASLASHQISLNVASLTFMVPLGVSSAAAVRVGQAIGRQDPTGASRAGWTAIALGVAFMACAAAVLILFPAAIARLYSDDPAVLAGSVTLLMIAAVFQIFDGCQIVASGALRGAGDTRTPMLCNLAFYWGIGLPVGWFLAFRAGKGAAGLWIGLCVALIAIGSVLLTAWRARVRDLFRATSNP